MLHQLQVYKQKLAQFKDKASCFPAAICSPPWHVHVIDACAAPGNKTSHLSAIMNNTGQIFAFDISKRRLQILETLTQKAGCKSTYFQKILFLF